MLPYIKIFTTGTALIRAVLFIASNWKPTVEIIKSATELFKANRPDPVDRKRLAKELSDALQVFQKTGDRKPLENILCGLTGNCSNE